MGDQLAGVLDQVGQQPEFGRGEADLLAVEPGAVLVEVDDEVAMLEPSRPVRGGRRGPPRAASTRAVSSGKLSGLVM